MSQTPNHPAARSPRSRRLSWTLALAVGLTALGACDELNARRKVQEAKKLYEAGKYLEAANLHNEALEVMPENPVVVHNQALTYHKLFKPGLDTKKNKEYAAQATRFLAKYLEHDPGNETIIKMMTGVWIDSGEYEKALDYWMAKLEADPKNTDVIKTVANIWRQAGEWEKAIDWYRKLAKAEPTVDGQADALEYIGRLTLNKLVYEKDTIFGDERLKVADIGIGAMQEATKLRPNSSEVANFLGALFQRRALAHGATWAWLTDVAHAQYHHKRFVQFRKAEQAEAEAAAEAAAEAEKNQDNPDPAKPSGGS